MQAVTKELFCQGMRRLASGVCVVSMLFNDKRYAMTASSVTSLSDDPASLLVCINQHAQIYPLLVKGQRFAVNILSAEQKQLSDACAFGDEKARFSLGTWQDGEQNVPYLQDAQASFLCQVDNDDYRYGTHKIVIGQVLRVQIAGAEVSPLVYVDGQYR